MKHPFGALAPEYDSLLRTVTVRPERAKAIDQVARKLLSYRGRYQQVADATRVPVIVLATLHERESSADFRTNLAQGDPLTRPSTHVPAGRPKLKPGISFPVSWEYAAVDAIEYDHLNDASAPWSMVYACWKGEAWNGFGPRNHGIHTGYLWGGTQHYARGKYVADGIWDANHVDTQLGIVPVMLRMVALAPELALVAAPAIAGAAESAPQSVPVGVGGGERDAAWIQRRLNALGQAPPLLEDGSYGRRTREAVRWFQATHGLGADGLAGPLTVAALERGEVGA